MGLENKREKTTILFAVFLVFVCLFTYFPNLKNEFSIDDFEFLSCKYCQYFPSFLSFFTRIPPDYQHYNPLNLLINITLFRYLPYDPIFFRLINLGLFYLNCLSLYFLITFLTKNKVISILTSLIFCLHPVNAENLNHITFNIIFLYTLFLQLSFIMLILYLEKKNKIVYFRMNILFFSISLLLLELSLIYILVIGAFFYLIKKYSFQETVIKCFPFLIVAILYLFLWFSIAGPKTELLGKISDLHLTFFSFIASYTKLVAWYVGNLLVSENLVLIFNMFPLSENILFWDLVFFGFLSGFVFLIFYYWKKDIRTFALVWFILGFIVAIPAMFGHAHMGLVIEPHWFYFTSIGFFLLISILLFQLRSHMNKKFWNLVILSIFIFHYIYSQSYIALAKTEKRYCEYWLRICPNNVLALMLLGKIYYQKGDFEKALSTYQKAFKICIYQNYRLYFSIGKILAETDQLEEAKSYLHTSLALEPQFAAAYNSLGVVYFKEDDFQKAEENFLRSIQLDPYFILPRHNLANLYLSYGKEKEARKVYEDIPLDNHFLDFKKYSNNLP